MSHDYQSVKNSRDRAQREVQRLRGVVNTQVRSSESLIHCKHIMIASSSGDSA